MKKLISFLLIVATVVFRQAVAEDRKQLPASFDSQEAGKFAMQVESIEIPNSKIADTVEAPTMPLNDRNAVANFLRSEPKFKKMLIEFSKTVTHFGSDFPWRVTIQEYKAFRLGPFSLSSNLPDDWRQKIAEVPSADRPIWKVTWEVGSIPWYGCKFWLKSNGELIFDRAGPNWNADQYCKYDPRK